MPPMAPYEAVPHVPSTSVRFTVPADLASAVDAWANDHQLSRDEGLEVLLRSRLSSENSPATALWAAYESAAVQTPAQIEAVLDQAEVSDPVIGIRLGAKRRATEKSPYPRDHLGADLDDDPQTIWPAVRGLWRINARWRYVAAYRLGSPLALYRIAGWDRDSQSGRRWATSGLIITGDRRQEAESGLDVGESTQTDRAVAAAIFNAPLAMASGAANPLVLLNSR